MNKRFLIRFIAIAAVGAVGIFCVGRNRIQTRQTEISTTREKPAVQEDEVVSEYQYSAPWDKNMYDGFYARMEKVPADLPAVKGGIVPHHLLAGAIEATFFDTIARQKPSVVVLIGPNHFSSGRGQIITTVMDWKTLYGVVKTDSDLVKKVVDGGMAQIDEAAMKEEHSIYGLIPFVKKSLPDAKVLSFILKNNLATSTLDKFVQELKNILPGDAVIVASIDFSHYQTLPVANFHDELSINVIKTFDYERLPELEIDSTPSLYAVMKLMENYGAQKIGFELHTNSATITGRPSADNTTSHYSPYFVSGPPETDKAVSVLNFGDIMLDRNVKKQIDKNGIDYLFGKLAGDENRFFEGMDIVCANLEGPFADSRRKTPKEIAFRFDPALLTMLKKYNFSLFSLANNHTYDMSAAGFAEAKKNLTNAGFEFYGNEYALNEKDSYLLKDVAGKEIAFIGLNNTHTPLSIEDVNKLIKKGRDEADFVMINVHWGEEYQELSNKYQRNFAHKMIDAGADVIIGHHPHVTEEIEIYKNKPIYYSLGNFIFDQYFQGNTQQGLGIGLVLYQDKISAYVFPFQSSQSQISLMKGAQLDNFAKNLVDRSRFSEYNPDKLHLELNRNVYEKK